MKSSTKLWIVGHKLAYSLILSKPKGKLMKVIYHKNCADGFCSAFLIWKAFAGRIPESNFYAANYGDPLPDTDWDLDETVVIADFSYPVPMLEELAAKVNKIIVLDHHKTTVESLSRQTIPGNLELLLDVSMCGASMVYTWLARDCPDEFVHVKFYRTLVVYVQDRDLWQWKLPHSKEISAAIASYDFKFMEWEQFFVNTEYGPELRVNSLKDEGTAILRYQEKQVKLCCEKATMGHWSGATGLFAKVNSSVLQSEIGNELLKKYSTIEFADVWYLDEKGYEIHSLRSRTGGVDVSAIAKTMGGGGHPCAAGFKRSVV